MFPSFACFAFYCIVGIFKSVSGYVAVITNNGPVVQGATIQFKVEIFEDSKPAHGNFEYFWQDVKHPENNFSFSSDSPCSNWNLTTSTKYTPGDYQVHLKVQKKHKILFISSSEVIIDQEETFTVTKYLNGEMVLIQGNSTRKKFIDSTMLLNQSVNLNLPDMKYISKAKNSITTFWFIDCVYYGLQNGFYYHFNYSKAETKHLIQALVVAADIPVNFTIDAPQLGNGSNPNNVSGDVDVWHPNKPFKDWLVTYNKTHVKGNFTFSPSDTCIKISSIPLNENYSYGLFSTNFTVKEPVKVSPINGTSWLKAGEILNITVSCTGSSPFKYCIWVRPGLYNVTGNEVCYQQKLIKNCSFNIQHLFTRNTEYTVIVFISNSISQVIKPIAVNIYKVTKHPQLSVIIVPVAFSIVAVITIIFGVAFYVQSKRSYTVEVADFDFANQSSDMEYKSFRERLRESVSNLFMKSNDFNDDDDDQVWSPTRKYGSMQ